MKNGTILRSLINICVIVFMLLVVIGLPWYFSSKSGIESNVFSTRVAGHLQLLLDKYSVVSKTACYTTALNEIIRKLAHFIEYVVLGLFMCTTLNITLRRVWLAASLSILASPLLAYFDEYHQQFVAGRSPRLFDVGVDFSGALIGIILVSIFFYLFNYIKMLKIKIADLENDKN